MMPLKVFAAPFAIAATFFASTAMPFSAVFAATTGGADYKGGYQTSFSKTSHDPYTYKRKANGNGGAFVIKPKRPTIDDFPSGDK